jgi:predicted transglutaminase-like cysteine proteinase
MRSVVSLALCSLFVLSQPAGASEQAPAVHRKGRSAPFMRINGPTLPPFGFVRFCESEPKECKAGRVEETRFDANSERMIELDAINRHVNRTIEPTTDLELYGETEYWTLPRKGKGDCEDYALLKRHMLIKLGWPASSLLMTVVLDEKKEGHAVLTARTAQGDFILDNKVNDLKIWYKVNYTFVMRQSYLDPTVWVSIGPKDTPSPSLLSGVKPQYRNGH